MAGSERLPGRADHPGAPGVRDPGALDAALARPFAAFGGHEGFPSLPEKAAALLHGLVAAHAFVDGNKRVGLAATLVWLEVNGRGLALDAEHRYQLTMRVADGSLGMSGLTDLLRDVIA
ncbi:MAG: type II toxin-antitoxin system death-on-curing family toxin [Trueperaceae bacterium]|nr:type II toxin-antitoxin system death-on-curing family toxin [Trueperaceae bacterium]